MGFYSITKKEILSFAVKWIDRTGEHHCEWSYPGSEGWGLHVFFSYEEYRPNTNTTILWKTGHTKGESHMREWG
jgi:hypothetical protein